MPFAPVVNQHPVTHRQFFASPGRRREDYLDGVVYPRLPVERTHQTVLTNLVQALRPQIKGSPCELSQDVMLGSGPTIESTPAGQFSYATAGAFVWADLAILLDRPSYFVPSNTVVTNPTVVIEVLSPAEQHYLTGVRFDAMRHWLDQRFGEYVLILAQHPEVAHYARSGRDDWHLTVHEDLDAVLRLPRVHCTVTLAELYAGLRDASGRPYVGPSTCPNCGHPL